MHGRLGHEAVVLEIGSIGKDCAVVENKQEVAL
jgi:hypothetical protein